ncbi:MAG TPA: GNAT family N-acetyltransferase [Candidatus Angelobacter sp.]|nr:GNAT family N-acetyltransferase [Candidatus Angelobacter sp.]
MSSFAYSEPPSRPETLLRYADAGEMGSVAQVWHEGLKDEPGSPWADYLTKWTPASAAKWFLDSQKRLGARFLVAEKNKTIVGMNGMIIEKRSGIGRLFTGVVVRSAERQRGIGSMLLYRTLHDIRAEGLHKAEVETRDGITASNYLYPKYGGNKQTVQG